MPSVRTGLQETPTGFGYREPRYSPDPGFTFSALDVACDQCKAPKRERCPGVRVCAARMAAARAAIAEGKLQSRGPAAPQAEVCPDCGKRKKNGRPLPCSDDAHRCPKVMAGYRCRYAVEPGTDLCGHHAMFAPQASKPGRKPKLTTQVLARVHELRAEGITMKEIAHELDVSEGTVIRWIRENPPAS